VWRSEITLWEDVARKSPDNARAQAIIGVKLIESRKIDLAIEHFQEALRIKPDYGDAMICLGNAYLEKGMLDEGYQQYLKALALGSMDFESRAQLMMNLGTYNFKKGFTDRAIYFYQNALSITPNVASIHQNLGQAYKLKGLSSLAAEEFARAHKLNPDRY
jgi:tetratricopeptide (TPR) repeat protein